MNRTEFKQLIQKIMNETFEELVEVTGQWDHEDPRLVERITNAAELFANNHENESLVHAHVENVAFPSGKDIKLTLSLPSSLEKRTICASLAGQNIVISPEQLQIPTTTSTTTQDPEEDPAQTDIEEYAAEVTEDMYPEDPAA